MDDLEAKISKVLLEVARQQSPALTQVERHQSMFDDLGFDSLAIAQLVAILEMELGVDPFATRAFTGVRTVGELVEAYRSCLAAPQGA